MKRTMILLVLVISVWVMGYAAASAQTYPPTGRSTPLPKRPGVVWSCRMPTAAERKIGIVKVCRAVPVRTPARVR